MIQHHGAHTHVGRVFGRGVPLHATGSFPTAGKGVGDGRTLDDFISQNGFRGTISHRACQHGANSQKREEG